MNPTNPTTTTRDKLALYHFDACPYCARVRGEIQRLGLDIELRDIRENDAFRAELQEARGGITTVPVLRIQSPDSDEQWMPESADIVDYLRERHG